MAIKGFITNFYTQLLTSICLIFTASVAADSLSVYSNEYVVELRENDTNLRGQNYESNLLKKEKALFYRTVGSKARLIGREMISSSFTSKRIVPFDPNDNFCEELINKGVAKSCSPNFVVHASATPNDPKFNQLWGMSKNTGINAPEAWDVHKGTGNIVVAVIDSGVDYNHPDLSANMWTNPGEIPGNGIDDDSNGYIDDVYGINAATGTGNPMDDNGHGTHVAGTIGGKGNNAVGVAGVNWNVKIMALKFLDANGAGSLAGAIDAIEYMTDMKQKGVNVVVSNNSWGGGGFSQTLYNAIKSSIDAGIVFAAAAGNSSNDNDSSPAYPASYDLSGIVSVAAMDSNQNMAGFSNYGQFSVDIGAPGVGILSTYPNNQYASLSGTSMATPHVAGAIALLSSYSPSLTVSQLINRIYDSGSVSATLHGITYTGRKLNIARALKNQTSPIAEPTPVDGCSYTSDSTSYSPSTTADNKNIVLQADEMQFYTLNLPFAFPFYDTKINRVYISPNGVIYTNSTPTSLDYQNSSTAPLNSIASLHTDLVAGSNPHGVRVSTSSSEVTIYWKAKHFEFKQNGDIEIRTTLKSTGEVQVYVHTSDAAVLAKLQSASTIGVRGNGQSLSETYAYNSPGLEDQTAASFKLNCSDEDDGNGGGGGGSPSPNPVRVTAIDGYGVDNDGSNVKLIIPKRTMFLNLTGNGTGLASMRVKLGKKMCSQSVNVALTSGTGNKTLKTPAFLRRYSKIRFSSGTAKENLKVNKKKSRKRARKRQASLDQDLKDRLHKRDCRKFTRKLGA